LPIARRFLSTARVVVKIDHGTVGYQGIKILRRKTLEFVVFDNFGGFDWPELFRFFCAFFFRLAEYKPHQTDKGFLARGKL